MKKFIMFCLSIISFPVFSQIPEIWESRGIGGGGALFSPSINPLNTNEYYVACDMSELFHTNDFGLSYNTIAFNQVQASNSSKVWFTATSGLLYCINNRTGVSQIAKSTDQGLTWSNVPGLEEWEDVYALYVDYHHPEMLVTNFWNSILFSTDGGNSFTTIHTTDIGSGAHLAGVFFNYPEIFIGLNEGLLVSHNAGGTFGFENDPGITPGQGFYSFTGARQNDTIRLMGTSAPIDDFWNGMAATEFWETIDEVWKMDYGISNWQPAGSTINWGTDFPMIIAMAENNIHTAYIGGSSDTEFPTVLKTVDGGQTWNHVFLTINNQNIFTGWCGYLGDHNWWYPGTILGIDVARFNADVLIISDMGVIHQTTNGGQNWFQAYTTTEDQNPQGIPTPKKKNYHSVGIENTSCWTMRWANNMEIFTGYSDISGLRSTDAGETWSFDYSGHDQNTMYWIEKHPLTGAFYVATSTVHDIYQSYRLKDSEIEYEGSAGKVISSMDGGATWQMIHDFGMPVYWVAIDPNNTEIMYASVINHSAGFGGIWKTENLSEGSSSVWVKIVNPTRTQGHPASIIVMNDGKVLTSWSARRNTTGQFTSSSGVFLYDPSEDSWQDLSDPLMVYWTKDISIDPADPYQNTWYACVFSGWGGAANDKGGLYRTLNRGQSWERIWITHRVESCSFNPVNTNELYVTTETEGLWFSPDIRNESPEFELVENYSFMHPLRVFFNPYHPSEVWITSFGNGLKTGNTATGVYHQLLTLKAGWSGISTYVEPFGQEIDELFYPVADNLIYLSGNNGIYWPETGQNTMLPWNPQTGYLIKMQQNDQLPVMGYKSDSISIQIVQGWNMIPVLSEQPINTQLLFDAYPSIVIIKEVAGNGTHWPAMGINTIDSLTPGRAYYLYSSEAFIFTFEN